MNFPRKPKPVDPGPSGSLLVVEADQVRKNFKISGLTLTRTAKNFKTWDRIRTQKNLQISDRTEPGPKKF